MPTVKCTSCQFLESPSRPLDGFFCAKLQQELENGYAMAFHAQKCEIKKEQRAYPSLSVNMPTALLNTSVTAILRKKKHEKILI